MNLFFRLSLAFIISFQLTSTALSEEGMNIPCSDLQSIQILHRTLVDIDFYVIVFFFNPGVEQDFYTSINNAIRSQKRYEVRINGKLIFNMADGDAPMPDAGKLLALPFLESEYADSYQDAVRLAEGFCPGKVVLGQENILEPEFIEQEFDKAYTAKYGPLDEDPEEE